MQHQDRLADNEAVKKGEITQEIKMSITFVTESPWKYNEATLSKVNDTA